VTSAPFATSYRWLENSSTPHKPCLLFLVNLNLLQTYSAATDGFQGLCQRLVPGLTHVTTYSRQSHSDNDSGIPISGLMFRQHCSTKPKRGDTRLRSQIRRVGLTDGLLVDDGSILAILTNFETEGGISCESLSVHPYKHWALASADARRALFQSTWAGRDQHHRRSHPSTMCMWLHSARKQSLNGRSECARQGPQRRTT
jgi:hypothetical protein